MRAVTYDELDRRVTGWRRDHPGVHIYPVSTDAGLAQFLAENPEEPYPATVVPAYADYLEDGIVIRTDDLISRGGAHTTLHFHTVRTSSSVSYSGSTTSVISVPAASVPVSVPCATWPSTIICSSTSSTAATPYGSNGSRAGYGAGGAYRLSVNDQRVPVVDSSTSSSSHPEQLGFRQNDH